MHRTFKYRLHPNRHQESVLEDWRVQCAQLHNAALEQRRDAYRRCGTSLTRYDQHKDLTALRASETEWAAVPKLVLRSALNRLDLAYKAFFRRCRAGQKPGFPRFRAARRYDSFSIGRAALRGNRVHVPKLGHVKLNLYRPLAGQIRDVVIRRDVCGKWWACFSCDLGEAPAKVAVASTVGIDLGLTSFAVLSNGEHVANPRYLRAAEDRLARRQQALSRKKKGSAARRRARVLVAKAHAAIANQRRDHARKLAAALFSHFDLVAFEALNIAGMVQHPNLSKSISDAAWNTFIVALTCKAENAGKWAVPVNPRGTSQRCSGCGIVVAKALAERWHSCLHCGLSLHRDHNAAINVLRLGQSRVDAETPRVAEASI
jgi:putative transposase